MLFTPVFGMLLHAANWRALGRPERARANLAWAWATIAAIVLSFGTVFLDDPATATGWMRFVMVAILVGWYFSEAKAQVRHVKARFPGGYARKPWIAPLAIGSADMAAFVVACLLAVQFQKPNPERLAAMVKDQILKEWQKQPALKDARIEKIVLIHKSGKTYAGFLDMAVGDETAQFAVEVVVDARRIVWEVKPISR